LNYGDVLKKLSPAWKTYCPLDLTPVIKKCDSGGVSCYDMVTASPSEATIVEAASNALKIEWQYDEMFTSKDPESTMENVIICYTATNELVEICSKEFIVKFKLKCDFD
jgi:hypothetical protein